MAYKLVVSDEVAFDVRWTMNDRGADREFGFRAEAARVKAPGPDSGSIGDYISKDARVRMVDWIGTPVIKEEDGTDPKPGAAAMAGLFDEIPLLPGVVLARYLEAIGPKAKLGNSPG